MSQLPWRILLFLGLFLTEIANGSSFYATTAPLPDTHINKYMGKRGPDGTRCIRHKGIAVCHNLLQKGGVVPQPFVDKSRGILVVYDGQIYNYRDLSHALGIQCKSDGEVLLPLYLRHGPSFVRHLDGEFALTVVDAGSSTVILATDIFSTKPLWYSTEPGLSVASYRSGVLALGGNVIRQVDPNSAIVFKLFEDGSVQPDVQRIAVHEFDLRQFKTDVLDYLQALDQAVSKRAQVSSLHDNLSSTADSHMLQYA